MAKTFKPYDFSQNKEPINDKTCEKLTGYTKKDLITLTGVFSYIDENDITIALLEGIYPYLNITLVANGKLELHLSIDISEKLIKDELLIIREPRRGIGLKVFTKHVEECIMAGFKTIEIEAARGIHKDGTRFVGYIVWVKFGFLMDLDSQKSFNKIMNNHNRPDTSLTNLLNKENENDKREAQEFWETFGQKWIGIFDLKDGSESLKILNSYINTKN